MATASKRHQSFRYNGPDVWSTLEVKAPFCYTVVHPNQEKTDEAPAAMAEIVLL